MGLFLEAGHVAEDGELLVAVPLGLMIIANDHSGLAHRLLQERARGGDSPWAHYVASLPPGLPHVPVCWGGGSPMRRLAIVDALTRALPRFAQTCRDVSAEAERGRWKMGGAGCGEGEWAWAYGCALSRGIRTSRGLALIPLVDFANHAHPANAVFGTRYTGEREGGDASATGEGGGAEAAEAAGGEDSSASSECSDSEEEIERAVARAAQKRRDRERAVELARVDPASFQFTLRAGGRMEGAPPGSRECLVSYGVKYDEAWVAHHGFLPRDTSSAGLADRGDVSAVPDALRELDRLEAEGGLGGADLAAARGLLEKMTAG